MPSSMRPTITVSGSFVEKSRKARAPGAEAEADRHADGEADGDHADQQHEDVGLAELGEDGRHQPQAPRRRRRRWRRRPAASLRLVSRQQLRGQRDQHQRDAERDAGDAPGRRDLERRRDDVHLEIGVLDRRGQERGEERRHDQEADRLEDAAACAAGRR